MVRETTLLTVHHPEFIGNEWQRVDHPVVRPLTDGAPDLGWEGDDRLVVYLCKPTQQFVLWRLETDGEYRPCAALPTDAAMSPDNINRLIRRLVAHDTRRGFDAYATVMAAHAKMEHDAEQERRAAISDFADKFHYGLSRSHLPGVWATRVRNVPSRRG